jgi:hypothetical protein
MRYYFLGGIVDNFHAEVTLFQDHFSIRLLKTLATVFWYGDNLFPIQSQQGFHMAKLANYFLHQSAARIWYGYN